MRRRAKKSEYHLMVYEIQLCLPTVRGKNQ